MAAPSPRCAFELLGSGHRGKVVAPSRIPLRFRFNPSRRSGGLYACGYDIGRHIADTMTALRPAPQTLQLQPQQSKSVRPQCVADCPYMPLAARQV